MFYLVKSIQRVLTNLNFTTKMSQNNYNIICLQDKTWLQFNALNDLSIFNMIIISFLGTIWAFTCRGEKKSPTIFCTNCKWNSIFGTMFCLTSQERHDSYAGCIYPLTGGKSVHAPHVSLQLLT